MLVVRPWPNAFNTRPPITGDDHGVDGSYLPPGNQVPFVSCPPLWGCDGEEISATIHMLAFGKVADVKGCHCPGTFGGYQTTVPYFTFAISNVFLLLPMPNAAIHN